MLRPNILVTKYTKGDDILLIKSNGLASINGVWCGWNPRTERTLINVAFRDDSVGTLIKVGVRGGFFVTFFAAEKK